MLQIREYVEISLCSRKHENRFTPNMHTISGCMPVIHRAHKIGTSYAVREAGTPGHASLVRDEDFRRVYGILITHFCSLACLGVLLDE
jgi:hypothetical protein